jgi:hypothetical protein
MVLCLIVFPDEPKSAVCFVCKQLGRLLNCLYCPRSYHLECLDPAGSGVTLAEGWSCPVCSILHAHGPTAPMTARQLPQNPELSNPRSSGGDAPFIEAPGSTILVDSARPEEISQSNPRKEWPQASSTQSTYYSDQQSSNTPTILTGGNLQEGMSKENDTPNRSMRGKLPDPSSIEPRIQFIHAHSTTLHHHNNASSKLG